MQRVDVDRPQPSMPAFTEGSVLPPYEPIRFPVNINALEKLAQTDPARAYFTHSSRPNRAIKGYWIF